MNDARDNKRPAPMNAPTRQAPVEFDNGNQNERQRRVLDKIEMTAIGDNKHLAPAIAKRNAKAPPAPADIGCEHDGDEGDSPASEGCDRDWHLCLPSEK